MIVKSDENENTLASVMENKDHSNECSSQAIKGAIDSNLNKVDNNKGLRITSIPLHLKWNETEIQIEQQSATSVTSEGSWHKCNFENLVQKVLQTENYLISIYHKDETSLCKTKEESKHFKSESISSSQECSKLRPSRKCKDSVVVAYGNISSLNQISYNGKDMQGTNSSPRKSSLFQQLRYKMFQHHITTLAEVLDIFCKALHVVDDDNAKSKISAFVHPKTRLEELEKIMTDGSMNNRRQQQMKDDESRKKKSVIEFAHTDVVDVHDIVMRASILIRLWQYTLCKGDSVSTSRPDDPPGWGELHNGKILEITFVDNREDMINRFILENVIGCYKFKSLNELRQYANVNTFIRISLVGYPKDAEIFAILEHHDGTILPSGRLKDDTASDIALSNVNGTSSNTQILDTIEKERNVSSVSKMEGNDEVHNRSSLTTTSKQDCVSKSVKFLSSDTEKLCANANSKSCLDRGEYAEKKENGKVKSLVEDYEVVGTKKKAIVSLTKDNGKFEKNGKKVKIIPDTNGNKESISRQVPKSEPPSKQKKDAVGPVLDLLWICSVCREAECMMDPSSVLLVCDGVCSRTFHVACAGLKEEPPEDTWFCEDCQRKKHNCEVCHEFGIDDVDVFNCDKKNCGLFYHEACLNMYNIDVELVEKTITVKLQDDTSTNKEMFCHDSFDSEINGLGVSPVEDFSSSEIKSSIVQSVDGKQVVQKVFSRPKFACPAHSCWTCSGRTLTDSMQPSPSSTEQIPAPKVTNKKRKKKRKKVKGETKNDILYVRMCAISFLI